MRTTLIIPDDLMKKVNRLSGEASKTRAVVAAMETYVKLKSREELLALRGKIQLDYDWERREEEEINSQRQREALLEGRR
jgi:metal-responsive CopG/Arc/MetJ family transcriptional regulator